MKRDPDLIRDLLDYIEKNHDGVNSIDSNQMIIKNYDQIQIAYHLRLLFDAGLIICRDTSDYSGTPFLIILRLTNDGHDFIEAARNDTAWNKTKDKMAEAGGFVLELAKPLLIMYLGQQLGLN